MNRSWSVDREGERFLGGASTEASHRLKSVAPLFSRKFATKLKVNALKHGRPASSSPLKRGGRHGTIVPRADETHAASTSKAAVSFAPGATSTAGPTLLKSPRARSPKHAAGPQRVPSFMDDISTHGLDDAEQHLAALEQFLKFNPPSTTSKKTTTSETANGASGAPVLDLQDLHAQLDLTRTQRFVARAIHWRDTMKNTVAHLEGQLSQFAQFDQMEQQVLSMKAKELAEIRAAGLKEQRFGQELNLQTRLGELVAQAKELRGVSRELDGLVENERKVFERVRYGLQFLEDMDKEGAAERPAEKGAGKMNEEALGAAELMGISSSPTSSDGLELGTGSKVVGEGEGEQQTQSNTNSKSDALAEKSKSHTQQPAAPKSQHSLLDRTWRLFADRYCWIGVFEEKLEDLVKNLTLATSTATTTSQHRSASSSATNNTKSSGHRSATSTNSEHSPATKAWLANKKAEPVFLLTLYDIKANRVFYREIKPTRKELLSQAKSEYYKGLLSNNKILRFEHLFLGFATILGTTTASTSSSSSEQSSGMHYAKEVIFDGLKEVGSAHLGYFHLLVQKVSVVTTTDVKTTKTKQIVALLVRLFDNRTSSLHSLSVSNLEISLGVSSGGLLVESRSSHTGEESEGADSDEAVEKDRQLLAKLCEQLEYNSTHGGFFLKSAGGDGDSSVTNAFEKLSASLEHEGEDTIVVCCTRQLEKDAATGAVRLLPKQKGLLEGADADVGVVPLNETTAEVAKATSFPPSPDPAGAPLRRLIPEAAVAHLHTGDYVLLRGSTVKGGSESNESDAEMNTSATKSQPGQLRVVMYDPLTDGKLLCERLFDRGEYPPRSTGGTKASRNAGADADVLDEHYIVELLETIDYHGGVEGGGPGGGSCASASSFQGLHWSRESSGKTALGENFSSAGAEVEPSFLSD